MTPNASIGQDASVAVLQAQQIALETQMRDGFANVTAELRRLGDATAAVQQVSARMEAHSDGLQRAFAEIRLTNERMEAALLAASARDEAVNTKINTVNTQIAWWRGTVIGASALITLFVGLCSWVGGKYVGATEKNSDSLQQLQRQVDALPYSVNRAENSHGQ